VILERRTLPDWLEAAFPGWQSWSSWSSDWDSINFVLGLWRDTEVEELISAVDLIQRF